MFDTDPYLLVCLYYTVPISDLAIAWLLVPRRIGEIMTPRVLSGRLRGGLLGICWTNKWIAYIKGIRIRRDDIQ